MPDGRCLLVCRVCGDDLVQPFGSWAERSRWAGAHTRGTGHDRWFRCDGWPDPARVGELLAAHDRVSRAWRRGADGP